VGRWRLVRQTVYFFPDFFFGSVDLPWLTSKISSMASNNTNAKGKTMNDRNNYEIVSQQQIEEGTANDNPCTVFELRHKDSSARGWVAGPHGVSCCAIEDWLTEGLSLADTREEAIATGCDA